MMSLHRSMHSSQMYTVGPAINFRTSSWLFPQNEQTRFPDPCSPCFAIEPPVKLTTTSLCFLPAESQLPRQPGHTLVPACRLKTYRDRCLSRFSSSSVLYVSLIYC